MRAHVYTTEPSILTRFPECPALSSSNNNNNKKGWRPVLIRGSACLTWLTRRALGRRAETDGEAKRDEKGGKMRGGCCHFRCLSYQWAERGLISSLSRRKMGLNLGFHGRFVPPFQHPLFSVSFFPGIAIDRSPPSVPIYPSPLLNRSSVENARSAPLLFSPWPFSSRQEIVQVLRNVNVQPLTLSGRS